MSNQTGEAAGMLLLYRPGHDPISSWMVWQQLYVGLAMAFVAASISTYGYELVLNLLGVAGVGPRSPAAVMQKAEDTVQSDPAAVARVTENNC